MEYEDLRTTLLSKGKATEDRRGHHVFFYVKVDGKEYRATKFSHSARGQITADIFGLIARQMRLTSRELREFGECKLTLERWLGFWRERAHSWRAF